MSTKGAIVLLLVGCLSMSLALAQTTTLRCRSCNRANSLDDCHRLSVCDASEACYMEEIITEQLTVVYNGGCRAKDVCTSAHSSVNIGKRNELVACSRCCDTSSDCNARLCAITSSIIKSQQCYSCDHRSFGQSEVRNPSDCVTLTTCQADEMCYATQGNTGGSDTFYYGCLKKQICLILMKAVFDDLKACSGANPDPYSCGNIGKRSVNLCHSCCGDGGCNYGTCTDLNKRLFRLHESGLLDPVTLKSTNMTSG